MPQGWGTSHFGTGRCKLHGGASPHAELAGVVYLARREATTMGVPLAIEPQDAILECIRIAAGEVAYASERIAELNADQAIGPMITRHHRVLTADRGADLLDHQDQPRMVIESTVAPAELHTWIIVRQRAMDRLVNYSATALKAGVEERQVKIAEQQGEIIAAIIMATLTELGVAANPQVPAIVHRQLTAIAGGHHDSR
jgi:hypothetical protein